MIHAFSFQRRCAAVTMLVGALALTTPGTSVGQQRQAPPMPTVDDVRNATDTVAADRALMYLRSDALRPWRDLRNAIWAAGEAAQARGDTAAARWFFTQEDRYAMLATGTVLPWFMRVPPAPFTVTKSARVRAYIIGDWGSDEAPEQTVADAVRAAHKQKAFQLGLTVGDNFYPTGINDPRSPRWKASFENRYGILQVPLFATLGNHDYSYDRESAAAEIAYTTQSKWWKMPAEWFTFTAGPVQFFALNTNRLSEYHLRWLATELDNSSARWKVVYGHHPLHAGPKSYGLDSAGSARLVAVLHGKVDVYLSGHHHSLQHTASVKGIEQFIVGGGGASNYDLGNQDSPSRFAKSAYGFGVIEADAQTLTVRLVGDRGAELYQYVLKK